MNSARDGHTRRHDHSGGGFDTVRVILSTRFTVELERNYSSCCGGRRRRRFLPECIRFASRRRLWEPRVGFVGRRGTGLRVTACSISLSRSRQSSEFRFWSRDRWLVRINSPAIVSRDAYRSRNRLRTSSGRLGLVAGDQRSTALLLTLLTFCPPGPELRTNVNWNSPSGI